MSLSKQQKQQLKKPCPLCQSKLEEVGDLADFKHNLITCTNDKCDYTMFSDGSLINNSIRGAF